MKCMTKLLLSSSRRLSAELLCIASSLAVKWNLLCSGCVLPWGVDVVSEPSSQVPPAYPCFLKSPEKCCLTPEIHVWLVPDTAACFWMWKFSVGKQLADPGPQNQKSLMFFLSLHKAMRSEVLWPQLLITFCPLFSVEWDCQQVSICASLGKHTEFM